MNIVTELIGDPLFQLNLMLWISFPQPPGGRFTPVLYDAGYKVQWISPKLSLSQEILGKLRKGEINSNRSVCPDLVLKQIDDDKFVLVECKSSGFSSESTTAKQAFGMLVMQGNQLRDSVGGPRTDKWFSQLVYVVKSHDRVKLNATLGELAEAVDQAACASNEFDTWGLIQKNDGVYLNFGQAPCLNISGSCPVRVLEGEQQDYRPLYLIPVDINISKPDKLTLRGLQERFRSSFLAYLPRILKDDPLAINIEHIWKRAVELWDIWEDKATKRYLIREGRKWLLRLLKHLKHKIDLEWRITDKKIKVSGLTAEERIVLLKEIQSSKIRKSDKLYEQLSLDFEEQYG